MTQRFESHMSKGVVSWPIKGFSKFSILAKLLLAKKRPKLGVQLPNAGDDNQSCHILTVFFNRIDHVRIPKYNLYSSTIFCTNVSISTAIREGPLTPLPPPLRLSKKRAPFQLFPEPLLK